MQLARQSNQGPSAARNLGLPSVDAQVPYVTFVDSDDVLMPEALAVLIRALEARPDAVGAAGLAELIDARGKAERPGAHSGLELDRRAVDGWRLRRLLPHDDIALASLALNGTIRPPATALLRRAAVDAVGGFRADLRLQEDWELYLRMATIGPIVSVPQQVAWYRVHDRNLTGVTFDNVLAQRVRRLAFNSPLFDDAQRRLVSRGWRLSVRGALHTQGYALYCHLRRGAAGRVIVDALGAVLLVIELCWPVPPRASPRLLRWKLRLRPNGEGDLR